MGDPAEIAAENERVEIAFARLVDDATHEERDKLHQLDTEEKREFVLAALASEEDKVIQESGPERTDPEYSNPQRRGNRLLSRKL